MEPETGAGTAVDAAVNPQTNAAGAVVPLNIFDVIPPSADRVEIPHRTKDPATNERMWFSFLPSDENTLGRYSEIRFNVGKKKPVKASDKSKSAIARASEWVARNRQVIVKGVMDPPNFAELYKSDWVSFLMSYAEGRKALCKAVNEYLGLERVDSDDDDDDFESEQ
jgi:hypothetical protein